MRGWVYQITNIIDPQLHPKIVLVNFREFHLFICLWCKGWIIYLKLSNWNQLIEIPTDTGTVSHSFAHNGTKWPQSTKFTSYPQIENQSPKQGHNDLKVGNLCISISIVPESVCPTIHKHLYAKIVLKIIEISTFYAIVEISFHTLHEISSLPSPRRTPWNSDGKKNDSRIQHFCWCKFLQCKSLQDHSISLHFIANLYHCIWSFFVTITTWNSSTDHAHFSSWHQEAKKSIESTV